MDQYFYGWFYIAAIVIAVGSVYGTLIVAALWRIGTTMKKSSGHVRRIR